MRALSVLLTGAAIGFGAASTAGAEDVSKLIEDCESCHGKGGASRRENIPVIGGMSAFYIEEQLRAYREDRRPCHEVEYPAGPEQGEKGDMCAEVENLTEDQIAESAAYFADKPFVAPDQAHDAALAAKGRKIHESNCRKCHSEGGGLAFDDAGILAGQWRPYLRQTFDEYTAGKRWQPEKMQPKIEALGGDEIEALIEFYVSQEPTE
jgi:sulfide dehydrogenase cytochrome subunit